MARKTTRRFDPRFGVSRFDLDEEAKDLRREMEDCLISSTTELHERLAERRAAWTAADANVEHVVKRLPERERLAIQCMLVRDLYHMMELYTTYVRSLVSSAEVTLPIAPPAEDARATPFSEWLFAT